MSAESPQAVSQGLSLTVTVSSQPAFVPTVEALAAKVGEFVGCSADDARRLGQAVALALSDTWRHLGAGAVPPRFDVIFHGNGRVLRVDVACASPLPGGVTLEHALGSDAMNGLRALVDRIEFGETDGCPYCRLTRQIRDAH
jgi:hypothetical protein